MIKRFRDFFKQKEPKQSIQLDTEYLKGFVIDLLISLGDIDGVDLRMKRIEVSEPDHDSTRFMLRFGIKFGKNIEDEEFLMEMESIISGLKSEDLVLKYDNQKIEDSKILRKVFNFKNKRDMGGGMSQTAISRELFWLEEHKFQVVHIDNIPSHVFE
jgi:hypothetical protein